ncbi:tetratricopeptide repeat protein [Reyranella sp.]|uniref:tetratricopeptide repeat protein n=1 Tax=Reyranella sp. TaxID=1929291 RepID=UPI003D112298
MRLLMLIVALLMSGAAPAIAEPLDDGITAYEKGDYATALRLWRPLAERGIAEAQSRLGLLYDEGWGVPQDYATAVAWYRKAAEQRHAVAQINLGSSYEAGTGVPQDYVLAHMWFNLAAVKGNDFAIAARDRVASKMTPAQIAEAQNLAREWKPK